MIDESFIDKIVELSHSEIVELNDIEFLQTASEVKQVIFPAYATEKLFSLSQLVNLIQSRIKEQDKDQLETGESFTDEMVNVVAFNIVELRDAVYNENRQISVFGRADFSKAYTPFPFGKKMDQESFIIALMTAFGDTAERETMLKLVSSVKADRIKTSDDDGIGQVVATRAGVALTSNAEVKKIWKLQTFVTFPEVEQPTIPYLLRLHQVEDELPQFALYECDGGKWKVDMTISVREYLVNRLKNELKEKADRVVVL